jgi:RNA processing factor Prp31
MANFTGLMFSSYKLQHFIENRAKNIKKENTNKRIKKESWETKQEREREREREREKTKYKKDKKEILNL